MTSGNESSVISITCHKYNEKNELALCWAQPEFLPVFSFSPYHDHPHFTDEHPEAAQARAFSLSAGR